MSAANFEDFSIRQIVVMKSFQRLKQFEVHFLNLQQSRGIEHRILIQRSILIPSNIGLANSLNFWVTGNRLLLGNSHRMAGLHPELSCQGYLLITSAISYTVMHLPRRVSRKVPDFTIR